MREILIVNRRLICLVLTGPWHVEVLVALASNLYAHVELRVYLGLLKVPSNFIGSGCGGEEVRPHLLPTKTITNLDTVLDEGGMVRVVPLGANRLRSFALIQILVVSFSIGVRYDTETWKVS